MHSTFTLTQNITEQICRCNITSCFSSLSLYRPVERLTDVFRPRPRLVADFRQSVADCSSDVKGNKRIWSLGEIWRDRSIHLPAVVDSALVENHRQWWSCHFGSQRDNKDTDCNSEECQSCTVTRQEGSRPRSNTCVWTQFHSHTAATHANTRGDSVCFLLLALISAQYEQRNTTLLTNWITSQCDGWNLLHMANLLNILEKSGCASAEIILTVSASVQGSAWQKIS